MKDDAKSISFVEDTAVAPEKLSEYIGRFLELIAQPRDHGGRLRARVGGMSARASGREYEDRRRRRAIRGHRRDVADLVLEFGGALSGEHGDGLVRGPFMRQMFGDTLYEAFREVKRTFDPHGIFNPGKIVDSPPMTSNLRFGAGYKTAEPTHVVRLLRIRRLRRSGRNVQRRRRVPQEARRDHVPVLHGDARGKAFDARPRQRAAPGDGRHASAKPGLATRTCYDVLDLCLECRACKAECPVGVDMARFKSEFLADYWRRHGTPLRARAIGHIHSLAKWGSRLAPVSNFVAGWGPMRALGEKVLGVDRRRRLPEWSARTFTQLATERDAGREPRARSTRPSASLFVDTFTNYSRPELGIAASEVIAAAGFDVRLASNGCCGRPLISQGLLADARVMAEANVRLLYDTAARGEALVFLEPSCLSAVREDAPALLRGDVQKKARVVADACVLFEDFVERALASGGAALPIRPGPSTVLLHGHCHQKAMGLQASARALLSRIPECTVVDLDAGCCGMAGSFGYSSEHYDVSRQIGERKLLPAVRAMGPGAVLVASGTSCREQVAHFTGARALHSAELLRSLLR